MKTTQTDSRLYEASFSGLKIEGLRGKDFVNHLFESCEFIGDFTLVTFNRCKFLNCTFKDVKFSSCFFDKCHLLRGEITEGAEFRDVSITNSKLTEMFIYNVDFTFRELEATFTDCNIQNVGFSGPHKTVVFKGKRSLLMYVSFRMHAHNFNSTYRIDTREVKNFGHWVINQDSIPFHLLSVPQAEHFKQLYDAALDRALKAE